jgi:histone chaperone ASF1
LEFTVKFLDSKPEDITLDSIAVGPVQMGKSQFFLEVDGPSVEQIARDDLLDVTALVLVCSYCGAEFERVGFFVFHYYDDEAMRAQPPEVPAVTHLMREIKVDDIRHTNFTIDWDTPGSAQKQVEELLSSIASSSHDAPPLSQPPLSSHHSSFAPPLSLPSAVDGR